MAANTDEVTWLYDTLCSIEEKATELFYLCRDKGYDLRVMESIKEIEVTAHEAVENGFNPNDL